MQALVFGRGLQRIVRELRVEEFIDLLQPFLDINSGNFNIDPGIKQKLSEIVFDIELGLAKLSADADAGPILETLTLSQLFDRRNRTHMLSTFQNASTKQEILQNRLFWVAFYRAWAVRTMETGFTRLVIVPKTGPAEHQPQTVELWLHDYADEPLSVDRLEVVLGSLRKLYTALAEYRGAQNQIALVAYVDSGTSFTIALKGVAEVIDSMKQAFADAWRGIRFRKNARVERDLQTLRNQLNVVAEIRERVRENALDPQTGARLEHVVNSEMIHLLEAGVLPATIETGEEFDRHEVLAAVRRTPLLGPGQPPPPSPPVPT